jgi:hypothetical protein
MTHAKRMNRGARLQLVVALGLVVVFTAVLALAFMTIGGGL